MRSTPFFCLNGRSFFRGGKVDNIPEIASLLYALQVNLSGAGPVQDGGDPAVQVIGELNALRDEEVGELAEGQAGISPVIRAGDKHIMQGTDLAYRNALGVFGAQHFHPGAAFGPFPVNALVVFHGFAVFHEDRTEGEDIHNSFALKGIRIVQVSLLCRVNTVEIAVLVHDQQVHPVIALVVQAGIDQLFGTFAPANGLEDAEAVMVRSADMNSLELPKGLLAIARAGAGVNIGVALGTGGILGPI